MSSHGTKRPKLCLNCKAQIQSEFCPDCGQKASIYLRSIRSVFTDVIGAVFSYDNKLWRSLALLCFRPGALTKAYWQGKRTSYLDPLRMFLFFSVVAFFAPDTIGVGSFQMPAEWTGAAAEGLGFFDRFQIGTERLASFDQFDAQTVEQFNFEVASRYLTLYVIAGVLGLALFLRLIRPRSFFVEHFIFGLHLACISYGVNLAIRYLPMGDKQSLIEGWGTLSVVGVYLIWAFQVLYTRPGVWRRLFALALSLLAFLAFFIPNLLTAQLFAVLILMPAAG